MVEDVTSCAKERDIVGGQAVTDIAFEEGFIGLEETADVVCEQEIAAKFPKSKRPHCHDLETMRRRSPRMSIVTARIFSR